MQTPTVEEAARPADALAPHELTIPEIEEILAIPDPMVRNLRVTLGYHDLSHALARELGYQDANWCTFAVWASREAGGFIRGDSVEGPLGAVADLFRLTRRDVSKKRAEEYDEMKKAMPKDIAKIIVRMRDQAGFFVYMDTMRKTRDGKPDGALDTMKHFVTLLFDTMSTHISRGNTKVFEEIARTFVPFIDLLAKGDDAALDKLVNDLDPFDRPTTLGGRQPLKRAFQAYRKAKREGDPRRRSALVYLANCLVGVQEQTLLQEEIARSLGAPIDELEADLAKRFAGGYNPSLARWLGNTAVRRVALPSGAFLASLIWKAAATRTLMALHLPNQKLDLGKDLPDLPDGKAFPDALIDLDDEEARDCVGYYNFAYGKTLKGTAANDWSSFPERMNSITNLFRSRQQTGALFLPPFTATATSKIRAGDIPTKLDGLGGHAPPPIGKKPGQAGKAPPQA